MTVHSARALRGGNLHRAEAAAHELRTVSLEDALRLLLLYRAEPAKYARPPRP